MLRIAGLALAVGAAGLGVGSAWAQAIAPQTITLAPGESVPEAMRRAVRMTRLRARLGDAAGLLRPAHDAPIENLPQIVSGSVASAPVNVLTPPAAPVTTLHFKAKQGFYFVRLEFTSAHGQIIDASYQPPMTTQTRGAVTFQDFLSTFSQYAEPGAWTLTYAAISDASFQETTYNEAQLATLFSPNTVTVVNTGTPDFTAPTVSAGKILTPRVHLTGHNPEFKASLTVADDVSGVAYPIIIYEAPNVSSGTYTVYKEPLSVLTGTIVDYSRFGLGEVEGTYNILGYGAVDAAGNMFLDQSHKDIVALFGKATFIVEN